MASNEMTVDDSRSDTAKQAFLVNDPGFMQDVVRKFLQNLLEQEMTDYLHAAPYERSAGRLGYRSGRRVRKLVTRAGSLSLDVPTERTGHFRTAVFDRYQRSEQAFVLTLQEMYLAGVSTRKVRAITEELCGTAISASTVSRLTKRLDEDLARWRNRRLVESYPYLIVDARYERVRQNERIEGQGVLVISGVSGKGQRDILTVAVANTESETSWTEVFRDLSRRGLAGVRLVVSDDHEGLVASVRRCFQGALWQRCQTHFMHNVLALVVGRGMKLAVMGVMMGLLGALALVRVLTNLLFEVKPLDPITFAVVSLLLFTVAALACWLPARRAAKVDPMEALRSE